MEELKLIVHVYSGNSAYMNRLSTLISEGWYLYKFYPYDYLNNKKDENPKYVFELLRDNF